MLINWQVRLISLNFIIIIINLRWSDNIKFRRHEIFYTGFGEGVSRQRALIARFKPNWNIKAVSMPFSCTFLGQFSLFNLVKNINQLQTELKYQCDIGSYIDALQAGDMNWKQLNICPHLFNMSENNLISLVFLICRFLLFTILLLRCFEK